MSEIKGQLLGIILVLMIFGVVSGAMVALFSNFTKTVESHVSEMINENEDSSLLSVTSN